MPFYVQTYLLIFIFILLINAGLWFKNRGKALLFIYELISGVSLIIIMLAYWDEEIKEYINQFTAAAFGSILLFDFYFSVLASPRELAVLIPEALSAEMEYGKAFSILFAAPAYITGFLLFSEFF